MSVVSLDEATSARSVALAATIGQAWTAVETGQRGLLKHEDGKSKASDLEVH